MCSISFFFPQNRTVYGIMWEKCDRNRQATGDNITQRMRIAYWTDKATDRMCNISFFCTAKIVTRTRLNITFIPKLLVLFLRSVVLEQRFSNFFQVGTTFISQNVLRTTFISQNILRTTFISQNVLRTTFISQNVLRTTLLLGLSNSLGLS